MRCRSSVGRELRSRVLFIALWPRLFSPRVAFLSSRAPVFLNQTGVWGGLPVDENSRTLVAIVHKGTTEHCL